MSLHLSLFLAPAGCHHAGWRVPTDRKVGALDVPRILDLARQAEAAKFDMIFMADKLSIDDIYGASFARAVEHRALEWPDPFAVLSALSAITRHIGLAGTVSSSFASPFVAARTIATLDHLSAGRAGFNVVTSTSEGEARNFGATLPSHAERYARANAFIPALRTLWDSWADNALAPEADIYAHGERITYADIETPWFSVKGPLTVHRPPQGHPVAIQAGGSSAFVEAAARHADVIFASEKPTLEAGVTYARSLRDRVEAVGRPRNSLKILPGLQPIIGATRAQADEKQRFLQDHLDPLATLTHLSNTMNYDWAQHDLSDPVPDIANKLDRRERFAPIIDEARGLGLSVHDFAIWFGRKGFSLVGTADDVADHIIRWYQAGAVDGFVIMPPSVPDSAQDFFDEVVPRLQDRGVFRKDYGEETLRERFGLPRPDLLR
ncbi:NtaA/DmoA family FMN-dependent monooxygenase [Agrobacterium tumefaciens]|uniref:Nitrilotriacetate monooxygenase protein n=1 Tax=Agrobacterium tumefaciens str. Kerr 14 TaxID=1183424 RepID=A0A1S7SGQ3_AGRTU|nr:NtaA/DmoA family FMN-dependent monooxygenase [Agrobacterium tumefaciens]AYM84879.1 LLM class flavin-dependent oxidoreductase [Agrobacterium tumefaciens]NTE95111.1 NtaA/DmoA family FMN-dependent monooxygenase [Agrobacterium tumefaciens]CUX68701.1 Nitrilotriacetate monooxygenase protein [Agrobacterium tumefaciens str. Kerr 14]